MNFGENTKELIEIIKNLSKNPNLVKRLETEIERMANETNCNSIYEMLAFENYGIEDPSIKRMVIFYAIKVLDMRIQRNKSDINTLNEEIEIVSKIIKEFPNPSAQAIEIYSQLGLYCFPNKMSNFFEVIILRLKEQPSTSSALTATSTLKSSSVGYKIFLSFLKNLNYSSKITKERRSELKKAIRMIINEFMEKMDEKYCEEIILIMKELLKIVPKSFDYSFVFNKALLVNPSVVNEFVVEGWSIVEEIKPNLFKILPTYPTEESICKLLTSNPKAKNQNLYEYMYKCISDYDCFISAIAYWSKVFTDKNREDLLKPVLIEAIKKYLEIKSSSTSDEEMDEFSTSVLNFLNSTTSSFPEQLLYFIKEHGNSIGNRFTLSIINKLQRINPQFINILKEECFFNNPILDGNIFYLSKDPRTPEVIKLLNFNDRESIKLLISILESPSFVFVYSQYIEIFKIISKFSHCEEVQAIILKRLNKFLIFGSIDENTIKDLIIQNEQNIQNLNIQDKQNQTYSIPPFSLISYSDFKNCIFDKIQPSNIQNDEFTWDEEKVLHFYFNLKKNKEFYLKFKNGFYSYFIKYITSLISTINKNSSTTNNSFQNKSFSIIHMLGPMPVSILQFIYENLPQFPLNTIKSFNVDLLYYLDDPQTLNPFISLEISHFISIWEKISDFLEFNEAFKSLIGIFNISSRFISDRQNKLINLAQIDNPIFILRILTMFNLGFNLNSSSLELDNRNLDNSRAIYILMGCYNSPNLLSLQFIISQSLSKCLIRQDGPLYFNKIMGLNINECEVAKELILKSTSPKNTQNILKGLLVDFRAKPINKMFSNEELKVPEQGLFRAEEKSNNTNGSFN